MATSSLSPFPSPTTTTTINLGPLTTPFASPPDCGSISIQPIYLPLSLSTQVASSLYFLSAVIYTASSCYPASKPLGSAYTTSTLLASPFGGHDERIFYSPGVCPSGWTSSAITTASVTSVAGKEGAMETQAFCCPPSFTAWVDSAGGGGGGGTAVGTGGGFYRCDSDVKRTSTVVSGSFTAVFGITSLRADALFVRYREGDFVGSGSSVAKITGTSSVSSMTGGVGGASQTSSPTPGQVSGGVGGLSSGAKIGLGVGVSLGVVLLGVLIAWVIFKRRRRGRTIAKGYGDGGGGVEGGPHYLPGYKAELDAASVSVEKSRNVEVDVVAAELDAIPFTISNPTPKPGQDIISTPTDALLVGTKNELVREQKDDGEAISERDTREQKEERERELELECQERRLRERREKMLEETESIARDEEELRRRRM